MSSLEEQISGLLAKGEDLVVAVIVSQSGSTPRVAGAKMAVRPNGEILGTIGGGSVEASVIKAAADVFETGVARVEHFSLTGADVTSMDMICGGNLTVVLAPVMAGEKQSNLFAEVAGALGRGHWAVMVTAMEPAGDGSMSYQRCVVLEGGEIICSTSYPDQWVKSLADQALRQGKAVVQEVEGRTFLAEVFREKGTVYIFGAGHVSQRVAALAKMVDFRVVVIDDRPEFANAQRFPDADEVLVPASFEGVMAPLNVGADSYLVIVTRGHAHDKNVLAQALDTPARYVGMIGSRRKRNAIYKALLAEGADQAAIDRVYSPIGLSIDAESPAEIAVSIVAELIQVRAGR